MSLHKYTFEDGEQIFFAQGNFDPWCVYRIPHGGRQRAPRDADYFADLQRIGDRNGRERIYGYFKLIYDKTDESVRPEVVELIFEQAGALNEEDRLAYVKVMMTIYYAMIAEENRQPEKRYPLKKKVKKIGIFQTLIVGMDPYEAANFSRGRPARELTNLLAEYEAEEGKLELPAFQR